MVVINRLKKKHQEKATSFATKEEYNVFTPRTRKSVLFSAAIVLLSTFAFFVHHSSKPNYPRFELQPYILDCHGIHGAMDTDDKESLFVTTKTNPPFQMSIHNPNKDQVSSSIQNEGCWECDHVKNMLDALSTHPDSYLLDIGGNIGMWTLSAAAANRQTFTIEPSPENYKRICATVNRNLFHDRVNVMAIAATTTPELFQLNVPKGNKGGTSVVKISAEDAQTSGSNIIKGLPIDSLNLPTNRPVVMKVDVEGHELQALLGAIEFLQAANVVYLMMELRASFKDDENWTKIFSVLSSKGLVPFRVDSIGETELDPNNYGPWKNRKHPKIRYFDVIWRKSTN